MEKAKVFISYSSKDKSIAEAIHLNLESVGFIIWRDETRLETDWSSEIAYGLVKNDIFCILWTENSSTSKWVNHEWLSARALEKRIIPCLFPNSPSLPEPLINIHGVVFSSINEGCNKLKKRISEVENFNGVYDYTIVSKNTFIPFNPNPKFIGRYNDLIELYLKIIGNLNKTGISHVGITGMGGVGKTQLAVEFAHRFSYAFHAIYWIQAASPDTWLDKFLSIAIDRIKYDLKDFNKIKERREYVFALQEYFKKHPNTLVIMDNVLDPNALNNDTYLLGFTPLTLGCNILFTTRFRFQISGIISQAVNVLSSESAEKLLLGFRNAESIEDKDHAQAICSIVGYLPLAIILVGTYLKKYSFEISFADYRNELKKKRLYVIDYNNISEEELATRHKASVTATLQEHWDKLTDNGAQHLFCLLGQFPESVIIPIARLALFADILPPQSKIEQPLAKCLVILFDNCLFERIDGTGKSVRLHPLIREFSYQLISGNKRKSFRAEAAKRLKNIVFDYSNLEKEVLNRGIDEVIEDLKIGVEWWGDETTELDELESLLGALRLSSHSIINNHDQLAGQLISRLSSVHSPGIQIFCKTIKCLHKGMLLIPINHSLAQPNQGLIQILKSNASGFALVVADFIENIVITSNRNKIIIWNNLNWRIKKTIPLLSGEIRSMSISNNGKYLVVSADDEMRRSPFAKTFEFVGEKIIIINLSRGIIERIENFKYVTKVLVSPTGKLCAMLRGDGEVFFYDMEKLKFIFSLRYFSYSAEISAATFSGSGDYFLCGYGIVVIWDLKKRIVYGEFYGKCTALAVTRDDKYIITGYESGDIGLSNIKGQYIRSFEGDNRKQIISIVITNDNRRFISVSEDGSIFISDIKTCKHIQKIHWERMLSNSIAILPNNTEFITGAVSGAINLWQISTTDKYDISLRHKDRINDFALIPKTKKVISASEDGTLIVWALQSGLPIQKLKGNPQESSYEMDLDGSLYYPSSIFTVGVDKVVVSSNGLFAVSAGGDLTLRVWDLNNGKNIKTFDQHEGSPILLLITSDDKYIISVAPDIFAWDIDCEKRVFATNYPGKGAPFIEDYFSGYSCAAILSNYQHIAVSKNNILEIWDIKTFSLVSQQKIESADINNILVRKDKKSAILITKNHEKLVWDLVGVKLKKRIENMEPCVGQVLLLKDNIRMVFITVDFSISVLDIETGEQQALLVAHDGLINTLKEAFNSTILISGSDDCTLKIWNLSGYKLLSMFQFDCAVTSCVVHEQERKLIIGDILGGVHILQIHKNK